MTSSAIESTLAQVQELEEQKKTLIATAAASAKQQADQAISTLRTLGFQCTFAIQQPKNDKFKVAARRQPSDKPCQICQFKTSPPHDQRSHRYQGDDKLPFSEMELQEKGYRRIE